MEAVLLLCPPVSTSVEASDCSVTAAAAISAPGPQLHGGGGRAGHHFTEIGYVNDSVVQKPLVVAAVLHFPVSWWWQT